LAKFHKAFSDNAPPLNLPSEERMKRIRFQLKDVFQDEPDLMEEFDATLEAVKNDPGSRQSMIEKTFPPDVPKEESYKRIRDKLLVALKDKPHMIEEFDNFFNVSQADSDLGEKSELYETESCDN
jgi:hypothetical protein